MKYIVLHREGTEWFNRVGNSLRVPFIEAESPEEAVVKAINKTIGDQQEKGAPMFLVCSSDGWVIVSPQPGWKVDPF